MLITYGRPTLAGLEVPLQGGASALVPWRETLVGQNRFISFSDGARSRIPALPRVAGLPWGWPTSVIEKLARRDVLGALRRGEYRREFPEGRRWIYWPMVILPVVIAVWTALRLGTKLELASVSRAEPAATAPAVEVATYAVTAAVLLLTIGFLLLPYYILGSGLRTLLSRRRVRRVIAGSDGIEALYADETYRRVAWRAIERLEPFGAIHLRGATDRPVRFLPRNLLEWKRFAEVANRFVGHRPDMTISVGRQAVRAAILTAIPCAAFAFAAGSILHADGLKIMSLFILMCAAFITIGAIQAWLTEGRAFESTYRLFKAKPVRGRRSASEGHAFAEVRAGAR